MSETYQGALNGQGLRIGVVVARFNETVTRALLDGAREGLTRLGVDGEAIDVAWTPGCFEIPVVARRMAELGRYDAVICLGAVIRGATAHFDYVCRSVTDGLTRVALDAGKPVAHGVLTVETVEQARDRAGLPGSAEDKGWSSTVAALDAALAIRAL